jgi:RNA polymerase sigma-70 factor (ECF subfamily)
MSPPNRYSIVHLDGQLMEAAGAQPDSLDFDATFTAHYPRIVRVVARVVADRSRAEELAVDAFVKWWQRPSARRQGSAGWLYRTAVRLAIDDLRRVARHARYERLMSRLAGRAPTPEDVHASHDAQRRTRCVLQTLRRRDAMLLILRSDGLSYEELAAALKIKPASIGTLLGRAQRAFRLEYVGRYGEP